MRSTSRKAHQFQKDSKVKEVTKDLAVSVLGVLNASKEAIGHFNWAKVWVALRTDVVGRRRLCWYPGMDEADCRKMLWLEDVESVCLSNDESQNADFKVVKTGTAMETYLFRAENRNVAVQWVKVLEAARHESSP